MKKSEVNLSVLRDFFTQQRESNLRGIICGSTHIVHIVNVILHEEDLLFDLSYTDRNDEPAGAPLENITGVSANTRGIRLEYGLSNSSIVIFNQ